MVTLLVRTWCRAAGRWGNCVRRYVILTSFDLTDPSLAAWRTAVSLHWAQVHREAMPPAARYEGLEWELRDNDDSILFQEGITTNAGDGLEGTGLLAPQLAGLILLRTISTSPVRSRGLQYLPFPPASWIGAEGKLTEDGRLALQFSGDLIATPINDTLGRAFGPLSWRRSSLVGFRISHAVARSALAQQRRRGPHWPVISDPSWL